VATPDIRTTNDMPITNPPSLVSLGLVPYNINPHYNEYRPDGYRGETRIDRLIEFVHHTQKPVLAIGEGSAIQVLDGKHVLLAASDAILVKAFVPDSSQEKGVRIQQVSNREDLMADLTPYL
jgi:dipeptidase E